jgi:hypothetical protein
MRERRWCGREGLVHHRFGCLHDEGTIGCEWEKGEGGRDGARSGLREGRVFCFREKKKILYKCHSKTLKKSFKNFTSYLLNNVLFRHSLYFSIKKFVGVHDRVASINSLPILHRQRTTLWIQSGSMVVLSFFIFF